MQSLLFRVNSVCLAAILSIVFLAFKSNDSKPVVIGYVTGYSGLIDVSTIDAKMLSHINYAFVNVKNNKAYLDQEQRDLENFSRLNTLKQQNPALQILISVGGWSWSENFSDAVLTDSLRKEFAKSCVAIIRKSKLDGVDIDWEYPGMPGEAGNVYRPEDKENFTLMFEAIRKELNILEKETGKKKLLTTATGGFANFLNHTEMGKAQQYLDYVNLMTYDYYPVKVASHHANLYASKAYPSEHSIDKAVQAYINAGMPASKIVVGLAFFGKSITLVEQATKGVGDTIASMASQFGKGYTFLKDSVVNKNGFIAYKDEDAKAPFLFNQQTKQFVTYDDEWSIDLKCRYVLKHQLAGVMFWQYHSDRKGYLLNQINQSFK